MLRQSRSACVGAFVILIQQLLLSPYGTNCALKYEHGSQQHALSIDWDSVCIFHWPTAALPSLSVIWMTILALVLRSLLRLLLYGIEQFDRTMTHSMPWSGARGWLIAAKSKYCSAFQSSATQSHLLEGLEHFAGTPLQEAVR
jgi:hypothetical protein